MSLKLEFEPLMENETKTKEFEYFRVKVSEIINKISVNGKIVFYYIDTLNKFELKENTTELSDNELLNKISSLNDFLN